MSNAPNGQFPSVETDLAYLINASGKLRMLSHQVVMATLLSKASENASPYEALSRKALGEFRKITAQLLRPGRETGLTEETGALLISQKVISENNANKLAEFDAAAGRLSKQTPMDEIEKLGAYVAGPLLETLNKANEAIRKTLDAQIESRQKEKEPLMTAASGSVDEITRLSKALQIVAMNASLEAQRAGDHGAAFGEIAREMRGLSKLSMDQATRLDTDLAAFRSGKATATGRPVAN